MISLEASLSLVVVALAMEAVDILYVWSEAARLWLIFWMLTFKFFTISNKSSKNKCVVT